MLYGFLGILRADEALPRFHLPPGSPRIRVFELPDIRGDEHALSYKEIFLSAVAKPPTRTSYNFKSTKMNGPAPTLASKRTFPGTPDQDLTRPRKRNATACHTCRARKTKCDNKKPRCSYCQSIGASCDESHDEKQPAIPDNQAILDRIDRLEWTLLTISKSNLFDPASVRFDGSSPAVSSTSRPHKESRTSIPLSNPNFYTLESILSWPVFAGQFNSHANLRQLITSPNLGIIDPLSPHSLGKGPPMSVELDSCSSQLDNFFTRIHVKNPILDEKEIRRWARELSFNGIGWDGRSCLIVSRRIYPLP
jgi:hypothetical protein